MEQSRDESNKGDLQYIQSTIKYELRQPNQYFYVLTIFKTEILILDIW